MEIMKEIIWTIIHGLVIWISIRAWMGIGDGDRE